MSQKKQDNFKRLAEARTNKIIGMLGLLGNLSNTSHYEYTEEQVDSMFQAIQQEIDEQRQRFQGKPARKKFRL